MVVVLVMVVVSMRVRQMLAYHRRLTLGEERRDTLLARHVSSRPGRAAAVALSASLLAALSPQQVLISNPPLPHLVLTRSLLLFNSSGLLLDP